MAKVGVRYIVDDVDAAIDFYCGQLGFKEVMHPAPTFAMLSHGDLRLVLSAPGGGPGGGQAMPDGAVPTPGGWNRSCPSPRCRRPGFRRTERLLVLLADADPSPALGQRLGPRLLGRRRWRRWHRRSRDRRFRHRHSRV